MKVLGVNHLALASRDLKQLKRVFQVLQIPCEHEEQVIDQGVQTFFFPLSSPRLSLEALEVTKEDSPIAKYLEKHPGGIHHFCIEVDTLEEAEELLRSAGIQLVYPEKKIGAHGAFVNFIHPKSSGGVLIEIAQYPETI